MLVLSVIGAVCLPADVAAAGLQEGQAQPSIDDLQKQLDLLKKQKEVLDAQKQLLESQQSLTAAQQPGRDTLADQTAAADAAKTLADAKKAAADAQKAQSDAEVAATKAALGTGGTSGSGITGSVSMTDKAGAIEATLLATKALQQGASLITAAVAPKLDKTKVVVAASLSEVPNFETLSLYRAQRQVVDKALTDAIAAASDALTASARYAQGAGPRAFVPAVGTILDSVNTLLSYFRTDYTLGGVDVALEESALVAATSATLTQQGCRVTLPRIYDPASLTASSAIVQEIAALNVLRHRAGNMNDDLTKRAADTGKALEAAKLPADTRPIADAAAKIKEAAAGLAAAIAVYDSWFGKLATVDDKGGSLLGNIVQEQSLAVAIQGGYLLVLKVQKAGGGYLIKKSLWTFFGGMPLYHMGGVSVSYELFEGQSGQVLASGIVPVYGGFVKAGDLPDKIK
jgi:hypothetical protein